MLIPRRNKFRSRTVRLSPVAREWMAVTSFLDPWDATQADQCWPQAEALTAEGSWPAVRDRIQEVITEFGSVVAKMGGKAPMDVVCLQGNRVECFSVDEVLQSLKLSARVTPDDIILTKFYPINPCMEFRLFLHGGGLRGVCSRNLDYPMPELTHVEGEVIDSIRSFLDKVEFDQLDQKAVLDVYLQGSKSPEGPLYDVFVLDIESDVSDIDILLLPEGDWDLAEEPDSIFHYLQTPRLDLPAQRFADRMPLEFRQIKEGT